jgi:hypothetical protein
MLGVTPSWVRQLLGDGRLTGERLGNTWLVPVSELARHRRTRPPVGRALATSSAWAVLTRVGDGDGGGARTKGGGTPPAHPTVMARINVYAGSPFERLAPRLRRRAAAVRLRAHARALRRLAADPRLVRSGGHAASAAGMDLADDGLFEAYVRASQLQEVASAAQAVAHHSAPNLLLHAVPDAHWPFEPAARAVWATVALLDLYDRGLLDAAAAASWWPGVSPRR